MKEKHSSNSVFFLRTKYSSTLVLDMLVRTFGSAVYGVEAVKITVEVSISLGVGYDVVGMADHSVKESLQRVSCALKANGYHMPRTKLLINLAPADLRKTGSAFDLPIAIAILAATEQLPNHKKLGRLMIMGEMNLDGSIHSIKGALPIAITARKENFEGLLIPKQNAPEAGMVNQLKVYGVSHIREVINFFIDEKNLPPIEVNARDEFEAARSEEDLDFADVRGQSNIKRALEIAAAGSHNAVLIGPPGAGKTMLAKRLPTILPPLTLQEALETTRIHSVAGKLPENAMLVSKRPFRSPHHTTSDIALFGGGSNPQPGEISLAHNGVLFLDELPEFKRSVLEVMRQPLEERKVNIARAGISVDYPASFMLIASMNPCPCGYFNHPEKDCTCPGGAVEKYLNKISGPLLDRIDLHVEVTPISFNELHNNASSENSATIRTRVIAAREIQTMRFERNEGIYANAQMSNHMLSEYCSLGKAALQLLKVAMQKLSLSARAYERILKVSRTIADLSSSTSIQPEHIAEAIQFRSLDREDFHLYRK